MPSRSTRTARPSGSNTSTEPSASLSTIMRSIVRDQRRGVDRPEGLGWSIRSTFGVRPADVSVYYRRNARKFWLFVAPPARIERATLPLGGGCSIH